MQAAGDRLLSTPVLPLLTSGGQCTAKGWPKVPPKHPGVAKHLGAGRLPLCIQHGSWRYTRPGRTDPDTEPATSHDADVRQVANVCAVGTGAQLHNSSWRCMMACSKQQRQTSSQPMTRHGHRLNQPQQMSLHTYATAHTATADVTACMRDSTNMKTQMSASVQCRQQR
jgi:hypothetical protein